MKPSIDLTGRRFGRLVAIRYSDKNDGRKAWLCQCDCGTVKEIRGANLRSGHTTSCGCYVAERLEEGLGVRHGMSDSPTHTSWSAMLGRCNNPNDPSYHRYGGVGIKVCDRWHVFENFLEDMGVRPAGKTLDRFPNKGGNYEPGNCRWATNREQSNNISTNRTVVYRGRTVTARELSDLTGVRYDRLRERLFKLGWDVERAISEPVFSLSEEEADAIRQRISMGVRQRDIAREFGISQGVVSKINRGVWKRAA